MDALSAPNADPHGGLKNKLVNEFIRHYNANNIAIQIALQIQHTTLYMMIVGGLSVHSAA